MPQASLQRSTPLDPAKFRDPWRTAKGEPRASVALTALRTLWVNTGSLCNIECIGCYMESGPKNDRLAYITRAEVAQYLDEIQAAGLPVEEIGFTGGEPFMNRDFPDMLADALGRGFRVLVLTNAMAPLWQKREALAALHAIHGEALVIRVSVDHYAATGHEALRGAGTWATMLRGLKWLAAEGFNLTVAMRLTGSEGMEAVRAGFARLFAAEGIALDARDPSGLVLFPDMDATRDVPEITTACWGILGVDPADMMCASQRMVVKPKGATEPQVVPCTLLPYDPAFHLGPRLADALDPIALNHPHCATFCVLGGANCTGG